MYSGNSNESEDEKLARRLQEEEQDRLTANQFSAAPSHADMSKMSHQERDDMMLARQMAQIDQYQSGINPHQHRREQMFSGNYVGAQRSLGATEPPGAYVSGSYNQGTSYSSSASPNSSNSRMGGSGRHDGESEREDRLAYARRLQEEAFSRMQAPARPPAPAKSTEESDLELAMKMQIEEGDPNAVEQEDEDMKLAMFMEESGVSIRELDDDRLAALKEEQGHGGLGGGLSAPKPPPNQSRGGPSSLGLGGGGGMLGGGLYGGRRDGDSDSGEDESVELEFGSTPRRANEARAAGIPSSIPPAGAARPNQTPHASRKPAPKSAPEPQAGIPAAIPPVTATRKPAPKPKPAPTQQPEIPAAIPPVNPVRKPAPTQQPGIPAPIPSGASAFPPPGSAPSAIPPLLSPGAIPPASINRRRISDTARQESIRLLGSTAPVGRDFHRQTPMASKSGGPGNSGGLSRMLPGASISFGKGRSGDKALTRSPPGKSRSAHSSMLGMMRGGARNSPKSNGRSVSPTREMRHRRHRSNDGVGSMLGDLPPGVNLADANAFGGGFDDSDRTDSGTDPQISPLVKKEKKKGMLKRIFGGNKHGDNKQNVPLSDIPSAIPAAIPGPPGGGEAGPLPHSVSVNRNIAKNALRSSITSQEKRPSFVCSVCAGRSGKMLVAMDRKFHVDCFRCMSCNDVIDPTSVFAVSVDPMGEQQPLHRKCYAEFYGVQCAVCRKAIPANDDGSVSFIKHPFFNTEQMCPCHADEAGRRRCTGCHRFEPEDEPFADLNDGGRCVCYSCCRTVIMNNEDVKPLWEEVLRFFEFGLGLPIWEAMREIPILVVDQAALNESQMQDGTSVHSESSQIMTRGLCLSEHDGSMSFRSPSQRFNESIQLFESCNHSGFMDLDVGNLKGNTNSEVMAILCLSGLPRDLTASVLAHEATHAWIKLHPDFKIRKALPAQVEEGCAQLVAFLFLSDGMESPKRPSGGSGPSDEKLRQYFKFSIETDDNDIYGEGYRRAAAAFSAIGISALLNHVVHYQEFPQC